MFEDQQPGGAVQVPGNLPISNTEPDDMFASVDAYIDHALAGGEPTQASASVTASPMEEPLQPAPTAFGGTPSALSAGILRPKQAAALPDPLLPLPDPLSPAERGAGNNGQGGGPSLAATTSQYGAQQQEMYKIKPPSIGRSILVGVIVVVVVVVLGGGGWWVCRSFINGPDPDLSFDVIDENPPGPAIAPTNGQDAGITTPPTANTQPDLTPEIIDDRILFGEPIDTDGDGLDQNRESQLSTDPNNWDTDGDELSDGDEVIIWKTDPLDPDTDGDTYEDGLEVRSGYNPGGPGRIFEPPPAGVQNPSVSPASPAAGAIAPTTT